MKRMIVINETLYDYIKKMNGKRKIPSIAINSY